MSSGNIVLVDQDICIYGAAFAAQSSTILYRGHEYPNRTALKKAVPEFNPDEIEEFIQLEPVSHAIQNCRQLIQSILDACAPVKEYRGYVTGPGNYRYGVATIQPYKGNRTAPKPIYYEEVKQFLLTECNGEEVCGIEADDKLVIEYLKNPAESIVATRDKDLATVEGIRLYNWKTKELRVIEPVEAKRNFYRQLLMGDSVDNILGVKGIGEAKADKLLKNVKDEKLMLTICYGEYMKAYGPKAWSALCENAVLLRMLRSEAETKDPIRAWKPCHVPQGVM